MDPVSAAGIALAVPSLAFQIFAGCVKGSVLLTTAHEFGKDGSILQCMLSLQEVQLFEWAKRAGLLAEERRLDHRLNPALIEQTLRALQSLLLDTGRLQDRYGLQLRADSISDDPTAGDDVSQSILDGIMGHSISPELRRDIMQQANFVNTRSGFPKRLRWAALDKRNFETFVSQIRTLVQELWHLLDVHRQDDLALGVNKILARVIDVSQRVDQLTSIQAALQTLSALTPDGAPRHDGHAAFASAAGIKSLGLQLEGSGELGRPNRVEMVLSKELLINFRPLKGIPEMGIASYNSEDVFVEWKQLPFSADPEIRRLILRRAENLAFLLQAPKHPDFQTLRCQAIVHDRDASKVGFVYEIPHHMDSSTPLRSLRSSFAGYMPSVSERVHLALQLIRSLHYFHLAGWLHKSIRSENVLLIGSHERINRPIMVGFVFSRPASPAEISDAPSSEPLRDIYRHPAVMGDVTSKFDKYKDIYALGTVLVEIGEWRSLKSIVEKVIDFKTRVDWPDLAKIRPFLLDDGPGGGLATLKFRMGLIYANVTKMMIGGNGPVSARPPSAHFKNGGPSNGPNSSLTENGDILEFAMQELNRCVV